MKSSEFITWINKNHIYKYLELFSMYKTDYGSINYDVMTCNIALSNMAFLAEEFDVEEALPEEWDEEKLFYATQFAVCCLNNYRNFLKVATTDLAENYADRILHECFAHVLGIGSVDYRAQRSTTSMLRFPTLDDEEYYFIDHKRANDLKVFVKSNIFDKFINVSNPDVMEFFRRFIKNKETASDYRISALKTLIEKNPSMLSSRKITAIYDYVQDKLKTELDSTFKPFDIESFRDPTYKLTKAFDDLSFTFQKNNKRKYDEEEDDEEPDKKQARLSARAWRSRSFK